MNPVKGPIVKEDLSYMSSFEHFYLSFKIRTFPTAVQLMSNFRINLPLEFTYSVLDKPKSTSALIEAVLGGHVRMQRKNKVFRK